MQPLVDVIIPTYKRSDLLETAINSILEQTYDNVKVTVVDDNNPGTEWRETTSFMMKSYFENKKVNYILHERNKNGSAARNTGFKSSNGKYVCFLDDDDCFLPQKIEMQVDFLEHNPDYDACYCDYNKNGEDVILPLKKDFSPDILLGMSTPQTSGIMFKRSVVEKLGGFDESYYRHQDYEFLLRFYDLFNLGKVDAVLYRRNRSDIDNNPNGSRLEVLKKKMLQQFDYKIIELEKKDKSFRKKVMVYNYIDVMKSYLKQRSVLGTLRTFFVAFKNNPILTVSFLINSFIKHKQYCERINSER